MKTKYLQLSLLERCCWKKRKRNLRGMSDGRKRKKKSKKRRATLVGDDEVKSVEDVRLMMEDAKVTNHQHQQKKKSVLENCSTRFGASNYVVCRTAPCGGSKWY